MELLAEYHCLKKSAVWKAIHKTSQKISFDKNYQKWKTNKFNDFFF